MFSRRKSTQRSNTAASPVKPPPPTLPGKLLRTLRRGAGYRVFALLGSADSLSRAALETSSDGDGSPFVVPLPTSSAISLTREGNPPQRRSSTASLSPSYRAPIVTQVAPSSYHRPSSSSRQGPDSPPRGSAYISASHPAGFTDPQPRSSQREGGGRFSIASLYPSPTAGLSTPSSASVRPSASLPNVRRSQKIPPSLNIMVVGARNTGKTSWIRAFLGNADLAGTAGRGQRKEAEERIATFGVARGGRGTMVERTRSLESMTVEVMNRGEKMSLTVVDMAGWETSLGGSSSVAEELEVERQLNGVIRNIEGRFDETLKAVSQSIRDVRRAPR